MKFKVELEIDNETIEDVLVTALEGGSNYWYHLSEKTVDSIKNHTISMEGEPLSLRFYKAINHGMHIPINDAEHYTDVLGKIHTPTIQRAFIKMHNDYPENLENIREGDFDAEDADIFFQLAVLGEIVYG